MSEIINLIEELDRIIFFLDEKNWGELRPDYKVNSKGISVEDDKARRKWLRSAAIKALEHATILQGALNVLNGI